MSATDLQDSYCALQNKKEKCFSTNEGQLNSYTNPKLITSKFEGKRIDYIMYRGSANCKTELKDYNLPLPQRVTGQNYSFSDHEAVFAELELNYDDSHLKLGANFNYKKDLIDCMNVCDEAMHRLSYHRRLYWFLTTFLFCMLFITIGIDAPFNFTKVYHLLRFFVTAILCFTLIMATLWNNIEYNAVLAGKLNMDVSLKQLIKAEKDKKV